MLHADKLVTWDVGSDRSFTQRSLALALDAAGLLLEPSQVPSAVDKNSDLPAWVAKASGLFTLACG